MSTRKKFTDSYYHGAATIVAERTNVTPRYVRDVLSGLYDGDGFTAKRQKTVKKIKEAAKPFKKKQNEANYN
ncbi:hypothetical protein FUA48_16235 [Flavobacterium alkalisoli]|uniref:Uncharacterized protein n=1 Tax=Flavobacterium alkalisoli TaxID=2602769 RepID=A0A5B9FXI5_9FLAO|nr:hypothetical protein [Flavobacterium alkalisoli]QEE51069.1 hypothetical protein FUA48_16235 [Flavobacterium alkalisoli]